MQCGFFINICNNNFGHANPITQSCHFTHRWQHCVINKNSKLPYFIQPADVIGKITSCLWRSWFWQFQGFLTTPGCKAKSTFTRWSWSHARLVSLVLGRKVDCDVALEWVKYQVVNHNFLLSYVQRTNLLFWQNFSLDDSLGVIRSYWHADQGEKDRCQAETD